LERLLRSGARFAAKAMVLSAASDDTTKIAVHGATFRREPRHSRRRRGPATAVRQAD
jgi:hypothetical protein